MTMQIKEMDDDCLIGLVSKRLREKEQYKLLNEQSNYENVKFKDACRNMLSLLRSLRLTLFRRNEMDLVKKIDDYTANIPVALLGEEQQDV